MSVRASEGCGSKVKGNTKIELTHVMKSAMLFIKVNITVTLHTSLIKSLALVSGYVPLDPAGRLSILFFMLYFY